MDRGEPRVGVVGKVTRIIDSFAGEEDRLMLDDIMRITGFPRSTTFRILKQLATEGWVEHDERGYRIGPSLSALTASSVAYSSLRSAAAAALNALHALTGAVIHLSVLEGDMLHYLDKIGGKVAPSIPSRVGGRKRAYESISGLVMLSQLPGEEADRLLAGCGDASDREALQRRLGQIRQQKPVFAFVEDEGPLRITYTAAPIMLRRRPIGAVSLATRGTLTRSHAVPPLLRTVGQIAENLQATGGRPRSGDPVARRSA
jgi:DNA-binding IclR family transcriptional regulator